MFAEFLLLNSIIFTAVIVGGVILALTFFGFIGNINISSDGGTVNISGTDAENELVSESDEEQDGSGSANLLVSNPVGKVKINGTNENYVKVHKCLYLPKATSEEERRRIKEIFNQPFLKKNGSTIEVTVPKMIVMGAMSVTVDLDISMPKGFNLKQMPGVNDTEITDTEGSTELSNSVGNMKLSRLKGAVTAHTNSGNITGEDLDKPVSITANAGNIDIRSMDVSSETEKLQSNVGNVDVVINNVDPSANAKFESTTSNVSVVIDKQARASIDAKTNMGQLNVDPSIKVISKGQAFMGGSVVAEVNGPGGKLTISTNMGLINIKLK